MGKNLDNLDDVKKMLSKKSREKIILKKRNQRQRKLHKIQKKRRDFHEQSFFLIPIIVLVLIVLIKILEALGFGASTLSGETEAEGQRFQHCQFFRYGRRYGSDFSRIQ